MERQINEMLKANIIIKIVVKTGDCVIDNLIDTSIVLFIDTSIVIVDVSIRLPCDYIIVY